MRANFASPSSFLTTHHSHPGDERDARSTEEPHRDTTSYQVATLPFEPPDRPHRPPANPAQVEVRAMCPHRPVCPAADSADRGAAHTIAAHPEQGWSLLCNGVIAFDDLGALLPDGRTVLPADDHLLVPIAA